MDEKNIDTFEREVLHALQNLYHPTELRIKRFAIPFVCTGAPQSTYNPTPDAQFYHRVTQTGKSCYPECSGLAYL